MADGGEEEPAMEGEGEAPPGQDAGASKEPSLPYCYSIALLAGEGVTMKYLQVCMNAAPAQCRTAHVYMLWLWVLGWTMRGICQLSTRCQCSLSP